MEVVVNQEYADAIVIGGGIIGASTVYHLAKLGLHKCAIIEQNSLGSGTTAYSASWVTMQKSSELKIRMSQFSLKEFEELNQDIPIGLQRKGSLSINTVDAVEKETAQAKLQNELGVPTEIWSREQIYEAAPILNVADIGVGRYCPLDGFVDAHSTVHAYIKKAKELGAKVIEGVKAVNIMVEGGRVVGVETHLGRIQTPIVVNAAGIYAKEIAAFVGLDLPLSYDLSHNVYTDSINDIPDNMPLIEILAPVIMYIGSRGKFADYTIGRFEPEGFVHKPQLEKLIEMHYDDLLYRCPSIAQAPIRECVAGIRTKTPDDLPIIGPISQIAGYVNNCGWSGRGVMHAPIAGKLAALTATGGAYEGIDIRPFLAERFDGKNNETRD